MVTISYHLSFLRSVWAEYYGQQLAKVMREMLLIGEVAHLGKELERTVSESSMAYQNQIDSA